MKKQLLTGLLTLSALLPAPAGVYTYSGPAYAIPDGNPNGVYSTIAVADPDHQITSLSVTLNVSGGYNGDLYAYLSYGGVLVPLLNRVGVSSGNSFGYSDPGFNITLSSSGTDVHFYGCAVR